VIVLLSDPRIAAVPVVECREPLVDLRAASGLLLDGRKADPAGAYARLRSGALARLLDAEAALPAGWRLLILEGYRPARLQRHYLDEHLRWLTSRDPAASPEELYVRASRYISPPEVAPHVTGGAVDLTLVDPDGREARMGTDLNATPEDSDNACFTDAENISAAARDNRRTLIAAMRSAGFVNYPTSCRCRCSGCFCARRRKSGRPWRGVLLGDDCYQLS
jgi:D-alanyl-D-alanine dipeptidase